jgi:hypothetical protein
VPDAVYMVIAWLLIVAFLFATVPILGPRLWARYSWRIRRTRVKIEIEVPMPETSVRMIDTLSGKLKINFDAKDAADIPAILRTLADRVEQELSQALPIRPAAKTPVT